MTIMKRHPRAPETVWVMVHDETATTSSFCALSARDARARLAEFLGVTTRQAARRGWRAVPFRRVST